MLPGWPRFLQHMLGRRVAATMNGFVDVLGFGKDMAPVLENFGSIQLDGLNEHFARHKFLLGDRPSLGDYGLIGPLFAHLGRDPLARRDWIDTRPHLRDWIARMFAPECSAGGQFFANDEVPATLLPALRSIFDEMLPFISACAEEVARLPVLPVGTGKPPRVLGVISYPMAGGRHTRRALSYPVWMAQRMLDIYAAMTPAEQQAVRAWLARVGGEAFLEMKLPRMQQVGLAAARVG
jgi:hypothetical protein